MDIGRDNGGVVDLAYEDKAPYAFTGTVKKVTFDLKPASHEDEQAFHAHAAAQAVGGGAAGLVALLCGVSQCERPRRFAGASLVECCVVLGETRPPEAYSSAAAGSSKGGSAKSVM